ncbi:hypothetical protein PHAVU_003G052501 [Phaseolus vulgaris]
MVVVEMRLTAQRRCREEMVLAGIAGVVEVTGSRWWMIELVRWFGLGACRRRHCWRLPWCMTGGAGLRFWGCRDVQWVWCGVAGSGRRVQSGVVELGLLLQCSGSWARRVMRWLHGVAGVWCRRSERRTENQGRIVVYGLGDTC